MQACMVVGSLVLPPRCRGPTDDDAVTAAVAAPAVATLATMCHQRRFSYSIKRWCSSSRILEAGEVATE
jgi:hypothetical protein